ncbi:MAG: PKD domain-containing protein [Chitinophagales bacterium]
MNIVVTGLRSRKIMVLEEGGFAIIGGGAELVLIKTDNLGNCYPDTQFTAEDTSLGLYQFDNQSQYADSYLWEFGDGNTDTSSTTSHQYQTIGTYEVCLTATNLCDSFTKCENIEVSEVTDIEVHEWEEGLLVYPNPLHNTDLFVNIPQSTDKPNLILYNSLGRQLMNQHSNLLEISELEAGIYYLQIQIGEEATTRKVILY